MIVRTGFQTFEFQQVFEIPKPMEFDRIEDALNWLKRLWSQHPHLIGRLREYLARHSADQDVSRLTDQQAIERLSVLLHSRKVLVIARENRSGGGVPTPRVEVAEPAFPLSERKSRAPSVSTRTLQNTVAPLWIRLDITQKQAAKEPGSLRLVGSTGYDKTLAIAGNFVPNAVEANTVDVLFPDVPIKAEYSLTYVGGDGTKSTIVQNAPFDSLKDPSMDSPAGESET